MGLIECTCRHDVEHHGSDGCEARYTGRDGLTRSCSCGKTSYEVLDDAIEREVAEWKAAWADGNILQAS